MQRMWIDLDGLANLRDVGGIPTTDGGKIEPGRLLRSDNLQDLTPANVEELLRLGLTDVVDLRSDYEAEEEGPTRLADTPVRTHQLSMFREWREGVGQDKPDDRPEAGPDDRPEAVPEKALPWVDLEPSVELDNRVAAAYMSYLIERPDSVLAALRVIADAPGATLVHCAAGKDRTGTIVALALLLVGADRDAVVGDYEASSERIEGVVARLRRSPTYYPNIKDRTVDSHRVHAETLVAFLDHIEQTYGGVPQLLARLGWTEDDTERLRAKLRD